MKKITLILGTIAAMSVLFTSCNQENKKSQEDAPKGESAAIAAGSIVYFDLDKVLEQYDMANDLRSVVETKAEGIQKEINRRQKNLENAVKDFNNKINKGLMTSATANEQQKKLQQQDAAFQQYAQQKQQEIMEENQVMMNQLADAIKTFIDDYNAEKQYAMILANQASMPVITADSSLDITEDVIAGLNERYVKEKSKKNE